MVSKKSKLIFLMPPKTASQSLRNALWNSDLNFDSFQNSFNPHNLPNTHLYLSELIDRFQIKNLDEFRIFQIYRDPLEKFVSGFYNFLEFIPKDFKIQNLNLNEFVIYFRDCYNSDDYPKCLYDRPNFISECIEKKINFGGTRYFVHQHKWNDLNQKINYLDINQINLLNEKLQTSLRIPFYNTCRKTKEILTDLSIEILSKIYKEDFLLIKNP